MAALSDTGQSLLAAARWSRSRPWFTYTTALLLFAVALASRYIVSDYLPSGFPFLTFFPAIVFAALIGGIGPGTLCAVLSVAASWYFFIPPFRSFELNSASALAVVFFSFIAAVDVYIIDLVVRTGERLHEANERSAQLAAQRSALFHELQHRVSNNLALVSAMAAVRARDVRNGGDANAAFDDLQRRLNSLAVVHRTLHDPATVERSFVTHFPRLAELHLQALGADRVDLRFDLDPKVSLPLDQSVSLAIVALELLTNAVKHAYHPENARRIDVSLQPLSNGECTLIVRDYGPGIDPQATSLSTTRLGMRVMKDLVKSMGATLEITNATPSGAQATVLIQHRPVALAIQGA